ncbi:MAG: hypothetical protein ABSB94_17140 [Syntrophorhabdales bacterium]
MVPITWAAYQASDSGLMEQHSNWGDALFTNVGSSNFVPQTGSPLIGTATWPDSTKSVLCDLNGVCANYNPPDKGAFWGQRPAYSTIAR